MSPEQLSWESGTPGLCPGSISKLSLKLSGQHLLHPYHECVQLDPKCCFEFEVLLIVGHTESLNTGTGIQLEKFPDNFNNCDCCFLDTGNVKSVFSLFIQKAQAEYADSLTSLAIYTTGFVAKNIF